MTTMIYTTNNQYAIVEDEDAAAYVAAGWSATPTGDIYTEPTRYLGEMTIPKAKTATKTKEQ